MTCWMWRNGNLEEDFERISPQLSSWGAFTTAGCENGKILLWSRHQSRLLGTLAELGCDPALRFPARSDLERLLERNRVTGIGVLRIVAACVSDERWDIQAVAEQGAQSGYGANPLRLELEAWQGVPPLVGHKTLARLAWDRARASAQKRGADDVLLTTEDGVVLETSVANVFARTGRRVATPPAPSACLPGVMRAWLMEKLPSLGVYLASTPLELDEVLSADEVWVSNAVIGVRRVASIGERKWSSWPVAEEIADLGLPAPGWPR
ncbi:MAG: aminotransferase class IV [bacterium]|nr:aminotransferase class IV [bacterium]